MTQLALRKTLENDLDVLFNFQSDLIANNMAAFTSENPTDKATYLKKWTKLINDPKVNIQTITKNDVIIGSVLHFEMMDQTNVSYWIGRPYWKQGFATKALELFVNTKTKRRPLYGRVAFDNLGSQKVLKNCGFTFIGKEKYYANARKKEIEEHIYMLS
ncbi:GNAT family N-acetyltransferase [Flavivirga spongiicola]|uniref:GNAT family N-acetyltransferase n=1 Tax=Flavivirga spongiicola TaxID=421621 RepID=A0ABU7XTG4_9FLAO|nr:GNAT family N-acetyltransferase [Flavivirga sp. MEBiC05379]MDO5978224.1 GNAT family N-acetyltransferase [Flavivirga sp. MEBiC05379]